MKTSETGWGYSISVFTWSEGRKQEVRQEIEELVEEIRKAIQPHVGDAKVTKGSGPIALPF
jgi:hypothetical protein